MKSAEQRDQMVVRVHAAVKKSPALKDVPVGGSPAKGAKLVSVPVAAPGDDAAYIAAVYELSYRRAALLGRTEDGTELVGQIEA